MWTWDGDDRGDRATAPTARLRYPPAVSSASSRGARYLDPLDALWTEAAARMGLRIERTDEVFASVDGYGRIRLGTPATLDGDDCLAQLILHELCHALVQGEARWAEPDWGLDNRGAGDDERERACLRTQAALLAPRGLRVVLAPTTDFRPFYDALPEDPLSLGPPAELALARVAAARLDEGPWAPHLRVALDATASIVHAVWDAGAPEGSLYARYEAPDDLSPPPAEGAP